MPRSARWRLVLVTVLAGLLHVLGCAHGAQAAGLPRTDALPAVAAASPHMHPAMASTPALCDHGASTGCTDADEPAAAGPRTDLSWPPATGGAPLMRDFAWTLPDRGRAACCHEGGKGRADHSRMRAALGVWRT